MEVSIWQTRALQTGGWPSADMMAAHFRRPRHPFPNLAAENRIMSVKTWESQHSPRLLRWRRGKEAALARCAAVWTDQLVLAVSVQTVETFSSSTHRAKAVVGQFAKAGKVEAERAVEALKAFESWREVPVASASISCVPPSPVSGAELNARHGGRQSGADGEVAEAIVLNITRLTCGASPQATSPIPARTTSCAGRR